MPSLRPFFFLSLVLLAFSAGCRKSKQEKALAELIIPSYKFVSIERLPVYFNQVVVIPVHLEASSKNISEFVDDIFNQEHPRQDFLKQFAFLLSPVELFW